MNKKWHINRRTFLQSMGYTLALPTLDIMIKSKKAYAANNIPHFIFDYFPNGFYAEDANNYVPEHMIEELSILGDNYSYFAKLDNPFRHSPLGHPHLENFLSFTRGRPFTHSNFNNNPIADSNAAFTKTFDQYLLEAHSQSISAPIRTLSILMHEPPNTQLPFKVFSWQRPNQPIPYYSNPKDVFNKIFKFDPSNKPINSNPGLLSILDTVKDGITSLNRKVSSADKLKLDQYFTSIREIEKGIQNHDNITRQCTFDTNLNKDIDAVSSATYKERLDLMQELMIIAHDCELTFSSNIMRSFPSSTLQNTWITGFTGPNTNWHGLSHYNTAKKPDGSAYQGNSTNLAVNAQDFQLINRWHTKNFSEFALKLDARKDPAGKSLLDKALLVHGSCQSKGPTHSPNNLFYALAGKAHDRVKTGVKSKTRQPLNNLWLTIMKRYGVHLNKFGDSQSEISQI